MNPDLPQIPPAHAGNTTHPMPRSRVIHRSGDEDFLARLMETICISELLFPGKELWLFAAWISDFYILDNRSGIVSGLMPDWPAETIRLTRWLRALAEAGTTLYIATNRDEKNQNFARAVVDMAKALPPTRIHFRQWDDLHAKGMIGDRFSLSGSFNFTRNGILVLDEQGRFDTEEDVVGQMQVEARRRWQEQPDSEEEER